MEHILTNKTPKLDLHGERADMTEVLVNQFIKDSLKTQSYIIRIIHGKSTNILTKEVHLVLKKHPNVEKFFLNNNNLGETIVYLK